MKIMFRGGAKEVGRSCIEVHTLKSNVLLDCGIKLTEGGTEMPLLPTNVEEVDGIFVTHAHLDHTGALPVMEHRGYSGSIFATKATRQITKPLLEDAFKIGRLKHDPQTYDEMDIARVLGFTKRVRANEEGKLKDIDYKFFRAGHIPGSVSVMLVAENKKILYTGDIRYSDTKLMQGADTDYYMEHDKQQIDALIIESTYGDREHPPRDVEEKKFVRKVTETLEKSGSVIVPVFAVGRAQEILMILNEQAKKINCPIYLDGMSKDMTKIILNNPESVRDPKALAAAAKAVKMIGGGRDRRRALMDQGIFITTSGMLTGGPVMSYLKHFYKDPDTSILLTGYQGEHTNGDLLIKKKQVYIDGWRTGVDCYVEQFDFSAHAGLSELKRIAKDASPETIIVNHGDPKAVESLAEWARALDFKVETPELGDMIKL